MDAVTRHSKAAADAAVLVADFDSLADMFQDTAVEAEVRATVGGSLCVCVCMCVCVCVGGG